MAMPLDSTAFDKEAIDVEWLELLMAARGLGISAEEVRRFLQSAGKASDAFSGANPE